MLEEIRASKILNGVRGALPTDKNALARLMLGISALCTAFPEIAELDLNPVLAYPQGVGIPDARILLEGDNSRGHGEAQRTGIDRHVATP